MLAQSGKGNRHSRARNQKDPPARAHEDLGCSRALSRWPSATSPTRTAALITSPGQPPANNLAAKCQSNTATQSSALPAVSTAEVASRRSVSHPNHRRQARLRWEASALAFEPRHLGRCTKAGGLTSGSSHNRNALNIHGKVGQEAPPCLHQRLVWYSATHFAAMCCTPQYVSRTPTSLSACTTSTRPLRCSAPARRRSSV